ncbi:hypothetical protein ACIPSJ_01545 [Streptomyces sp. NPDC090088]|uniref:hypothetical protein n=1 Tax=Streptomyces sp. NPDC090088 TaxID=3365944 RepID=UPI0038180F72
MAALAKVTVVCPGCHEPMDLSLILDRDAQPGPGELVLAVDRKAVEQHRARHNTPAADA